MQSYSTSIIYVVVVIGSSPFHASTVKARLYCVLCQAQMTTQSNWSSLVLIKRRFAPLVFPCVMNSTQQSFCLSLYVLAS